MKKLEFLLQKEGDRAWLPLETPSVEILEGRYRVVGRIPHPNADIEIRVFYTSFHEVSPQRQAQSRSARTNPEGLVVIIPYTRLKPGIWQLSCLPDPHSKPAQPWQHGVQLEVLSLESETAAPLPPLDEGSFATPGDRFSQNPAKPEPQSPKISEFPSPQTPQPKSPDKLQLVLDRETFVAQLGRPLIISGKIDIPQPPTPILDSQTAELKKLIGSAQLQIYLREPQTSQVLAAIQQQMPEQLPPCLFACVTYIPAECKSRLILGEAILSSGSVPLATQFFTITARLEQILDVIEDNFGEPKPQTKPSPTAPKQPASPPNLSFLKLVEKSLDNPSPPTSTTTEPLPPQLSPLYQVDRSTHPLELPAFGHKPPHSNRDKMLSEVSNTPQTEARAIDSQTQWFDYAHQPPTDFPNPLQTAETAPIEPKLENSPQPETAAPETQPAPTKQAFQTLNVQNRFWSRLSSLASNSESPEWLTATALSPTQQDDENSSDEIAVPDISSPTQQPDETSEVQEIIIPDPKSTSTEAQEFVIFEESSPPPPQVSTKATTTEAETTALTPYILPEDDLVPMPVLELPRNEILAGRLVKVRVQLPELMPRIYVKIWVYDRQTYLILDGPHWITEFKPNGLGKIQATVELEIPYGCMEVEFEAIAVEMQTQRESHKVTVHRQVLPPAGPTLPLNG